MWQTRPRPDPDSIQTGQVQALTAYQPPLTGGPVVVNGGPAAVNDGPPMAAVVDRHRCPQITIVIRCGGWTNWKVTRHHGNAARFRKSVRGSEIQYKV
nr:hypothetical protein [Tanacetum cinerariifolium]